MDLGIQGRVAFVTGASQGIGLASAIELAREGARVAILARRASELESAVKQIEDAVPKAEVLALQGDVTDEEDMSAAMDRLREWRGDPEILVNTVGIRMRGDFRGLSNQEIRNSIEGNVFSVVYTVRAVLPSMVRMQWGRIVNISAVSGRQPTPGQFATNLGKTALLGLTKNLSLEVAENGITVNCVLPGRIGTANVLNSFSVQERKARSALIPMKRYGEPSEVAAAILFLCSEQASYITGVGLAVDGGLVQAVI
jgi:3-oxoacyl-[acyl-carrier protein] reductase